jgi:acyl dehydratase
MTSPKDHAAATLKDQVGHDFGASAPVLLDQQRIDGFARCTGDDQWIHVDVERARSQSPFGNTIAHGLLLLSLIPAMHFELGVYPADALNVLNYGFEKVRFLAPVPAGSAVYLRTALAEVSPKQPGTFLVRCTNALHVSGHPERPVMVADSLALVVA